MPCSKWKNDNIYTTQFCLKKPQSNWTKAEDLCQESNGHLASILTSNEEAEIQKLKIGGCGKDWWIGLKWEMQRFTWSDQSPFNNFKSIVNGTDNNPCFYFHEDKRKIDWNPSNCEEEYCFVCKYRWIASSASSMSLSGDGTNTKTTAFISTSAHPLPTKSRSLRTTYATITTSFTPTLISSTISRTVPLTGLYNELTSTSVALALVPSPTSMKKGSNMPVKRTDADTSSAGVGNSRIDTEITVTLPPVLSPTIKRSGAGTASAGVGNSQLYTEITLTTVALTPVPSDSPTIKRSGAVTSSAGAIGGSVAGVCVAVATVSVVLYACCRKKNYRVARQQLQANDSVLKATAVHLTDVKYHGQTSSSQPSQKQHNCYQLTTVKTNVPDDSSYAYAYATASVQGRSQNKDLNDGSVKANDMPLTSSADEQNDDIYWQPAKSVDKLYAQFDGNRFRRIVRCEMTIHGTVGSGEFGTVAKATWQGSGGGTIVAVKMLNSSFDNDRVRFLQEGAIMGQFKHSNIVALRGLVLEGEPLMVAIEFMENGDLKTYLQTIKERTGLASRLLRMAREIAAGMKYLAYKAFVHRDLAIRNVMLDSTLTCKIGDFGLSRDLVDNDYYMTQGGRIPIRWTAPEAVMYRKYSLSSDVWSYGIVLYEIWTVGRRPYDQSWSNDYVVEMVDEGYRLPPPPGCAYSIYKLMIKCWHPDRHLRPTFVKIVRDLDVGDDELLTNDPSVETISGILGDDVASTAGLYSVLQNAYRGIAVVK